MTAAGAYKHLLVSTRSHLRIIQFNRPQRKNAINRELYEEITAALNEAAKDDNITVAALTGAGEYYSSGNDLGNFAENAAGRDMEVLVKEAAANLQRFVSAFIDFPKILTAVVNGPAIGIAATTLALCDAVYASEKATFLTPFSSLGLVAEGCSTYTFPRLMGTSKASEMLLFNKKIDAAEAKACRLVSEVFSDKELAKKIWPRLEEISKFPAKSLVYSKALIRNLDRAALHAACAAECKQLEERWQSEDCLNAIVEFMQRRSKL